MKKKQFFISLTAAALTLSCLAGCAAPLEDSNATTLPSQEGGYDDLLAFRPVDCGVQAQDVYEYPYIGMTVTLPATLLEKLDSREVFLFNYEEYTAVAVSWALMRFSLPTQEQQAEETMGMDFFGWEESLSKLGAIGVYEKSVVDQLDALTLCDTHKKLGESSDGKYEYYLSTASGADAALVAELSASEITLTEMLPLDLENGYSAFSDARIEGLTSVGNFTTEDVFGAAYDQTVFSGYDLTLVNIFATWCSPCVQEMPELEQLRQEYADKGIKLGIVAMVMDARTENGIDSGVLEKARQLSQNSGAQFPFLIPDETMLNGRLEGIMAYPESFFVDGNGNIVSEPYVGANTREGWSQIVEAELKGGNS